jgi:hypothetical protein
VAAPFRFNIFFPTGDQSGLRILSKDHWVGQAVYFPRHELMRAQEREELRTLGVYVLGGYGLNEDGSVDDLPKIYVGQSNVLGKRIGNHDQNPAKDFWEWCIAFSSTNNDLNAAHADWLEQALIRRAKELGQSKVTNNIQPNEAKLNSAEKAIIGAFFEEILSFFPLVGIQAFEKPRKIKPKAAGKADERAKPKDDEPLCDMVIVPAKKDGFERVFLGENRWWAIRISGNFLHRLKYICAYQVAPISAVTHWAEVDRIEPYGDKGKFQLFFKGKARKLENPLKYEDLPQGFMQGPKYINFEIFKKAKTLKELFFWKKW